MLTITGSGHLTPDPELRHTNSGKAVTDLRVACDDRDDTAYIDVVRWERHTEAAAERLVCGQAVAFRGRPQMPAYLVDDEEDPRSVLVVVGADVEYGVKPTARGDG